MRKQSILAIFDKKYQNACFFVKMGIFILKTRFFIAEKLENRNFAKIYNFQKSKLLRNRIFRSRKFSEVENFQKSKFFRNRSFTEIEIFRNRKFLDIEIFSSKFPVRNYNFDFDKNQP